MAASSLLSSTEIYYFVPKASCRAITNWLGANVPVIASHFHGSFMNWAIRFAQQMQLGSKSTVEMSVEEQQLYQMLRQGFPVTDPEQYVLALEYYHKSTFTRSVTTGPLGSTYDYARGHIKTENFANADAIRDGRHRLFTLVHTRAERDHLKMLYPKLEEMVKRSGGELDDTMEVGEPEKPLQYPAPLQWASAAGTWAPHGDLGALAQQALGGAEMQQASQEPLGQMGGMGGMADALDEETPGDRIGEWDDNLVYRQR